MIVALLMIGDQTAAAQSPSWHLDVGVMALVEAWDLNQAREELAGVRLGVDRHVWKGLAIRAEGVFLSIAQAGKDGSLAGFTLSTRARWRRSIGRPFVELGAGMSQATVPIPARGTTFNLLLVSAGGIEIPFGSFSLDLAMRWLHLSNNGREGRHRNPDVQSVGPTIAIGWSY